MENYGFWSEKFNHSSASPPPPHSNLFVPITVAQRSMAWTVFGRADSGAVGSNLNQGIDV
jgi:hypothetical protein